MKLVTAITVLLASFPGVASQDYFPFVLLGDGFCVDSNNSQYPQVFLMGSTASGPQDCFDFCTQGNVDKLVGVTVDTTQPDCFCQLNDDTEVYETDYPNTLEANTMFIMPGSGTGNVENTVGLSRFTCYRNEVSIIDPFAMPCVTNLSLTHLTFFLDRTTLHLQHLQHLISHRFSRQPFPATSHRFSPRPFPATCHPFSPLKVRVIRYVNDQSHCYLNSFSFHIDDDIFLPPSPLSSSRPLFRRVSLHARHPRRPLPVPPSICSTPINPLGLSPASTMENSLHGWSRTPPSGSFPPSIAAALRNSTGTTTVAWALSTTPAPVLCFIPTGRVKTSHARGTGISPAT